MALFSGGVPAVIVVLVSLFAQASTQGAVDRAVQQRIGRLEKEVQALRSEVAVLRSQLERIGAGKAPAVAAPENAPPVADAPSAETVSAGCFDIAKAYSTNEFSAEAAFSGRLVTATGPVLEIGTRTFDPYRGPYVKLNPIGNSLCLFIFDRTKTQELAKLQKGQTVTIQGQISGFARGEGVVVTKSEIRP